MAEVILRLSSALVGWLLIFSHGLLLAVVPQADCSPELWRTSSIFAAFALVAAVLLPAALQWRAWLRWLALPATALWIYGLYVASGLLWASTIEGVAFCDSLVGGRNPAAALGWERAWAPLQIVAILLCASQAARYWKGAR